MSSRVFDWWIEEPRRTRGAARAGSAGHDHDGGDGLDAVPQVLQPQVLVFGVLVVVVVHDGQRDGARSRQRLADEGERQAPRAHQACPKHNPRGPKDLVTGYTLLALDRKGAYRTVRFASKFTVAAYAVSGGGPSAKPALSVPHQQLAPTPLSDTRGNFYASNSLDLRVYCHRDSQRV